MKKMKKVEVIIEAVYLNRFIDLLLRHDVSGYTIIKDIEGMGGHGLKTADEASDLFSNNYIFTLCEQEKYDDLEKDLRAFLDRYGGKCILSDVMVLLGEQQRREKLNLQYSGKQ